LTAWDARIADRMRRPGCLLVEVTEAGSYSEANTKALPQTERPTL